MRSIDFRVILGIVVVAISFIVFPIILEGTDEILSNANIADYTGLEAIVKIAPMLVMVGLIFGGGLLIWKGTGETRRRRAAAKGKSKEKRA